MEETEIIDADGSVLGRLATSVVKSLKEGKRVIIVNAENAIISGNKEYIVGKYMQRRRRADVANPRKGPKFPRRPDMIVRRTIRGMLPYKTRRGKEMLGNLNVYIGIPPEFGGKAKKQDIQKPNGEHITVLELSEALGWKNPAKR